MLNYLNNPEPAEKTLKIQRTLRVHAAMFRADASDQDRVNCIVEAIEEKFGSLDILVPNAPPINHRNRLINMKPIFTGKCMIL